MHSPKHNRRIARPDHRRAGFTLVEIMIVVLIIGVLLNIALPALVAARDRSQARSCIKNLTDFETAKEQYAIDNKIPESSTVAITWGNISSYIRVPTGTPATGPVCPGSGSAYSFNNPATLPTCTYGGPVGNLHTL